MSKGHDKNSKKFKYLNIKIEQSVRTSTSHSSGLEWNNQSEQDCKEKDKTGGRKGREEEDKDQIPSPDYFLFFFL